MLYFPSGNIILVPVNQGICKNWINFKQNSYSNYKQENQGRTSYRKIYFTKDWFQGASSQTKGNVFKNNWKVEILVKEDMPIKY